MQIIPYLQKTKGRSRRKIVTLIKNNQLILNNKNVQSFKTEIKNGDNITIIQDEGNNDTFKVTEKKEENEESLIILNKPKGYVVSKSDPHNTTIYELLPKKFENRYYIGRLDKDSRGLVLLTNIPSLVNQFEHPKFQIKKEYLIHLSTPFCEGDRQKVRSGIIDEGEQLKFLDIKPTKEPLVYKVTLNEGKKRHIRRVIKKLGYNLTDLQRIKEAQRSLPQDLKEGEWEYAK